MLEVNKEGGVMKIKEVCGGKIVKEYSFSKANPLLQRFWRFGLELKNIHRDWQPLPFGIRRFCDNEPYFNFGGICFTLRGFLKGDYN